LSTQFSIFSGHTVSIYNSYYCGILLNKISVIFGTIFCTTQNSVTSEPVILHFTTVSILTI